MCLGTKAPRHIIRKDCVPVFVWRKFFMESVFNYSNLFKQALQKIKCVRNPHASNPEYEDMGWNDVRSQVVFDFGGNEREKYERIVSNAVNISTSCVQFIILQLGKIYGRNLSIVDASIEDKARSKVYFVLKDVDNSVVLLFKELEKEPGWKVKDKEPESIQMMMRQQEVDSCKYVYMVYDNAYLQIIGHNDDESDPGRGYNVYGLKWFWEHYFGKDEYNRFCNAVKLFIDDVNEYLGYAYIKTLGNTALINFKKIIEHELSIENYDLLLTKSMWDISGKEIVLPEADYKKIRKQFFDERAFLVLVGTHDFAESIITAEWLYTSMKQAKAIDLTVIGTGYFKAVEQLLYELMCLHRDEGRKIKKNKSKEMVSLSEVNIKKKDYLDTTLGSMANFYKDNMDILRNDICGARDYVKETIFAYVKVRNGYFHKHNIHDWHKIDEIRRATFQLLFLVLGSLKLSNEDKEKLGRLDESAYDDYYKLCEYVNYHSNELFFINLGRDDVMAIAVADIHMETEANIHLKYSGVYFKELGKEGRIFKFNSENLPNKIYTAKFVFAKSELIDVTPVKRMKIFEEGKFIGPSIVDEDRFSY